MKEVHVHTSVYGSGTSILVRTFLPLHYPLSVREEYLEYQFWDSLQGLSSYIRGILTSQYILVSLGVGDSQATALNASLLWACKDGIGIIASLVFAYTSSDYFVLHAHITNHPDGNVYDCITRQVVSLLD